MTALFMLAAQVAQEAIKPEVPNMAWTGWAVAALAVAQVTGWLKTVFVDGHKAKVEAAKAAKADDARDQAMAGYPEGTVGAILRDHAGQLTANKVEIKNICDRLNEIRADNKIDHTKIFDRMDTMKDQIFDKLDEVRQGK